MIEHLIMLSKLHNGERNLQKGKYELVLRVAFFI